jgi:hypothetical protein
VGDGKKEDGEERQARECFKTSAVLVLVLVLVLTGGRLGWYWY